MSRTRMYRPDFEVDGPHARRRSLPRLLRALLPFVGALAAVSALSFCAGYVLTRMGAL